MCMEHISVLSLANRIPDEAAAYRLLEQLRWGDADPVCPHCECDRKPYFLRPLNGTSRKTTRGTMTARRVWKCAACRKQFSVLTGTVFHGSHVSVRTWLFVIFEMVSSKNGVSAREIERKYDVTPKTAWFLLHRVREAMRTDALVTMFTGTIAADETFVGGKERNKHQQGRTGPRVGAGARKHYAPKTIVLTLVDKTTGQARSQVIPDVTGATLRKAIATHVDMPSTTLHTDAHGGYKAIAHEFLAHEYVDHSHDEYVRGNVTSNQAENFFSQLKRSLDGTHHHVSGKHLHRYLAEFDFRYSTRTLSDSARMRLLFGQVAGKRLSYSVSSGRA